MNCGSAGGLHGTATCLALKNGYCVTAQRLAGLRRTDGED